MATKKELLKEAQTAGAAPADATEDDYTAAELAALVSGEHVAHERVSADKPVVAPDGHVNLSQADIDARQ